MRVYWRVFLLALQQEMQYRANLIGWFVVGALAPIVMVMVWFSVLGEKNDIGGYAHGDFILYYIAMSAGWYIIGGAFSRMVGRAIKKGEMNVTLLKPYNLVIAEAMKEQAWKATSLFLTVPIYAVIVYTTRQYISWQLSTADVPALIVMTAIAAYMFALLQAMVGLLAFWVTEIWPFGDTLDIILYFFGGMLAPLTLLPQIVQTISAYLPFRYIFYEPTAYFLGKTHDALPIIGRQIVFAVLLYGLYKLMWRAGVRRYEGIGG